MALDTHAYTGRETSVLILEQRVVTHSALSLGAEGSADAMPFEVRTSQLGQSWPRRTKDQASPSMDKQLVALLCPLSPVHQTHDNKPSTPSATNPGQSHMLPQDDSPPISRSLMHSSPTFPAFGLSYRENTLGHCLHLTSTPTVKPQLVTRNIYSIHVYALHFINQIT
jgi:hypothetical protein